MIRMLRAGATSELWSWVANVRGSPSAEPTKSENSTRLCCSALRMASSRAYRSALLKSPAATRATGLRLLGVRRGQLGGALARAAEPLVLARGAARALAFAADHAGDVDQQPDDH